MCNGRLAFCPLNFGMKVSQPCRCWQCELDRSPLVECVWLQEVIERAMWVIIRDQVHVCLLVSPNNVRGDKSENVFMAQWNCLVDFCLSLPRSFTVWKENFDCHISTAPFCLPNLTIPSFTHTPHQGQLLGNCSLYLEEISTTTITFFI